jgi:hypothetical protein
MSETKLGKITHVKFGMGGYQDAQIGIGFTLGGDSWAVGDFWGDWSLDPSKNAQWTDADRINNLGKICMRINKLLEQAKVQSVDKLKNIPIEATFDVMTLKSWRVLTEVL